MFYRNRYYFMLSVVMYAVIFPHAAHAYLDAGTGSYLIQLVVAFVAGGLFMVKAFWRKALSFLSVHKKKPTEEATHHFHNESKESE